MIFLPIVRRELQAAARRKAAFQTRFAGGAIAAALGGVFLLASALPHVGSASTGRSLFRTLIGIDFGFALLAGVLLTADCLSRERREGTLGFLFLTDLSGFDVVAGKFTALALVPLHALLATVPVVALTVFMGGVTGGEFWRVVLALLCTLFLSLSMGLWVSSFVSDDRRAMGVTLGSLVLLAILPALVSQMFAVIPATGDLSLLRIASPAGVLFQGLEDHYRTGRAAFWWGLLAQFCLGGVLLARAAVIVRSVWREGFQRDSQRTGVVPVPRTAPFSFETRSRHPGIDADGPLHGLTGHTTESNRLTWSLVLLTCVGAGMTFGVHVAGGQHYEAGNTAQWVVSIGFYALKILLAVHAVYSLQECCRSGAMELLMVTPVSGQRLWRGHLMALRNRFLLPFVCLGILQISLGLLGGVLVGVEWPSRSNVFLMGVVPPLLDAAVHGVDLVAVAFHASRWALHYDRPAKALARTTLLVLLLPGLFCGPSRILIDLVVIGLTRPKMERFRDLVRSWFFPGTLGIGFGAPRSY